MLICPTALDAAFEHQTGDTRTKRTLTTLDLEQQAPYVSNLVFPMWAIHAGHRRQRSLPD